jgi:hypothetical protein
MAKKMRSLSVLDRKSKNYFKNLYYDQFLVILEENKKFNFFINKKKKSKYIFLSIIEF